MTARPQIYHVVAALICRDDEVLLVKQQGPRDPAPFWALPGGQVEPGELATEALVREVREETGLRVRAIGPLAYVCQVDSPADPTFLGVGAPPGSHTLALAFAVTDWDGDLGCADPDGLVSETGFMPRAEAIAKLAELAWPPMVDPAIGYLQGTVAPGAVWCYRRRPDGSEALVARL
jgi:8-oxo-dGTP diphosphatase